MQRAAGLRRKKVSIPRPKSQWLYLLTPSGTICHRCSGTKLNWGHSLQQASKEKHSPGLRERRRSVLPQRAPPPPGAPTKDQGANKEKETNKPQASGIKNLTNQERPPLIHSFTQVFLPDPEGLFDATPTRPEADKRWHLGAPNKGDRHGNTVLHQSTEKSVRPQEGQREPREQLNPHPTPY